VGLVVIHAVQEDHTMPAPLSLDIRLRFQRCIEDGLSGREAARRLMISLATGARLAKRVRSGAAISPAKCGRPVGWGKLGACKDFLLEVVAQDPDITLRELQGALAEAEGVHVNQTSLSRALGRLGFTYKKSRWSRTSSEGPMSPEPGPTG
jgi:transposase